MRIAARIILIVLGMWGLIGLIGGIIIGSDSGMNPYLPFLLLVGFYALGKSIGEYAWLRPWLQFSLALL